MSTNQATIDVALGKIGVIEAGESANATDSATTLGILNRMMEQWSQRSMDFNWFTQDTLTDTLPVPKWAEGAIIANLAVNAASDFRVTVTAEVGKEATEGIRTIGNTLINGNLENMDMSHLPQGSGRYSRYDIETDT